MAQRLIRGRRWLWLGATLFLLLFVVRAPAALVGLFLPQGPLVLESARGTLWNGSAELWLRGQPTGLISWRWLPSSLREGELGVAIALEDDGTAIRAKVFARAGSWRIADANGHVDERALLRLLQPYDLRVDGRLEAKDLQLARIGDRYDRAAGELRWSGGLLAYRMQGRRFEAKLPAMYGPLQTRAGALLLAPQPRTAVGTSGLAPLLRLQLRPDGWFVAGATRSFIELAGQPWQGGTQPAEIVLEVEEQLF